MSEGTSEDIRHMRHALRLAARGLGRVAPNPAVGCVIIKDGRIVGRGWTQRGGRPHAEAVALAQAGSAARGATVYVSLEPCSHHGVTPPCADALITASVERVVGAVVDPDPRVSGRGFEQLRAAGITLTQGVLDAEAAEVNAGFFKRVAQGRPLVALKIAQSADGYVADASGKSKWITGEEARRHGHLLRAQHDAIMVGIGTVLADDPMLTCRLPGMADRSPLRVVLDTHLRLSATSQLARTARDLPVLVFTTAKAGDGDLAGAGVEIHRIGHHAIGRPDLAAVLHALAQRGVTRLLVEGGPTLHAALLHLGLADMVHIYTAPTRLRSGLRAAQGALDTVKLELRSREMFSPDVLESYAVTV